LNQIESLNLQEYITIVDQYISNEEVGWYFNQADVVVLPYLHATQSGVIPIAYHFRKPVIATNVGGLPDVIFDGETGFLVPPDNPTQLANKIGQFHSIQDKNKFRKGIENRLELFSWAHLVQTIKTLREN
jgi:glycosyltransferase involved in cell wall biosynthesis